MAWGRQGLRRLQIHFSLASEKTAGPFWSWWGIANFCNDFASFLHFVLFYLRPCFKSWCSAGGSSTNMRLLPKVGKSFVCAWSSLSLISLLVLLRGIRKNVSYNDDLCDVETTDFTDWLEENCQTPVTCNTQYYILLQ